MATFDDVKAWFDRDLRRRVTLLPSAKPTDITFTTARYLFTITTGDDYLGGWCQTRRNASGKNHPLFMDLPDGNLQHETWQALLQEIKRLDIQEFRGPAL